MPWDNWNGLNSKTKGHHYIFSRLKFIYNNRDIIPHSTPRYQINNFFNCWRTGKIRVRKIQRCSITDGKINKQQSTLCPNIPQPKDKILLEECVACDILWVHREKATTKPRKKILNILTQFLQIKSWMKQTHVYFQA